MPAEDLRTGCMRPESMETGKLNENKAVGANDVVKSVRTAFEEELW